MSKLKNSLVDACVVVGINQDSELLHLTGGPELSDEDYSKYGPYKQHVLGVFTESLAYFPDVKTKIEGEPFYTESQVLCPAAIVPESGSTPRSPGYRRSISYSPEARRVLPFSSEVINSLPTFCFPAGGYVYSAEQKSEINYLVLTNMEGLRTYAISITLTTPYLAVESTNHNTDNKNEKKTFELKNAHNDKSVFSDEDELRVVYVPVCICLVSLYPYINTLRNALSSLMTQIDDSVENIWRSVMKMSTILTSLPVPPPGPLSLEFRLFGGSHVLVPPDEGDRRVIDIDLHIPLLMFSPEDIVTIVTCLITQQRMVFVASSYALLTVFIECFLTYIDPIKWRLPYVPVLPDSLVDLVEAPGPFIMGVHTSLKNQVKQLRLQPETPSIVLVDIDRKQIDLDNCNLTQMPDVVSQSLIVRLRHINPHIDIKLLSIPTSYTFEEVTKEKEDFYTNLHMEIKDIFLDMLLSLFGDIFNFMTFSEHFFDKDSYLKSRHDDERSFFIEVLASDAFDRFVDNRLENHQIRDAFTMLGERIATNRKTASRSRSSYIIQHMKRSSTIMPQLFIKNRTIYHMPLLLEETLSSGNFYRVFRDSLSYQLDQVKNDSILLKASFLFLRGFAHLACDEPIEALRDFYALYSSAPDLFPKVTAAETLSQLEPQMLEEIQNEAFYKQTIMFRTFTTRESEINKPLSRRMPTIPLSKADFEKRVKALKIMSASELIDVVFDIISESLDIVLPEQFSMLYKVYSDIKKHSENREVSGVKLKSNDRILKVSSIISTMYGMGRIVMTTNLLLFIRDGAREFSKITPLSDIKEIIKYQHSSVFWTGVQSLRIINSDRNIPPFYACLKDERDVWLLLLNEMSAGHKSSIVMKDEKLVDLCVENVLIARTLIEMGFPTRAVEAACIFVKKKASEIDGLTEETKEALEMRLDPCVRESKRTTVMCLAFVPGNPSINESASIWCGMGSGAIMIYDTDKWNCVSELRSAKNRISCLQLVGTNQIWAGSFDSVIYVINTETRKSEQQLQNHTDMISDIISHTTQDTNETLVWSCSYNGQVLCWDPVTREARKKFVLQKVKRLLQIIMTNSGMMWCIAPDRMLIVDTNHAEFPVLQKLILYDDISMPIWLEYALKVNENEIWVGTKTDLCIWDINSLKYESVHLDSDVQICSMIHSRGSIWIGNKDGKIILMDPNTRKIERTLHVHTDLVKSMCETSEGHVITGSASKEGKVCVWNAMFGFEVIDGKMKRVNKKVYEEIKQRYEVLTDAEVEAAEEVFPPLLLPALVDHF